MEWRWSDWGLLVRLGNSDTIMHVKEKLKRTYVSFLSPRLQEFVEIMLSYWLIHVGQLGCRLLQRLQSLLWVSLIESLIDQTNSSDSWGNDTSEDCERSGLMMLPDQLVDWRLCVWLTLVLLLNGAVDLIHTRLDVVPRQIVAAFFSRCGLQAQQLVDVPEYKNEKAVWTKTWRCQHTDQANTPNPKDQRSSLYILLFFHSRLYECDINMFLTNLFSSQTEVDNASIRIWGKCTGPSLTIYPLEVFHSS